MPLNHPPALEYLEKNNCLSSYTNNRVDIRYDPKLDRIVFLCYDSNNNLMNATGRLLSKNNKDNLPKWFIYNGSYPFICKNKPSSNDIPKSLNAVITEDCASATCVSYAHTGIALLGTNFKLDYLHLLKPYKKVYLMLDKDALVKSLKLHNSLRYYADVSVVFLAEDLKYLDQDHLREFLGKHIKED